MSLRDHLQSIYDKHGKLTPGIVVQEARAKNHPLHDRFEWDDKRAGDAWRRQQAHELIRSVRVVYREATETDPEASVRAWHAVRSDQEHVYEPAQVIAEDPLLTQMLLRDMEREWKQLHRRYGHMVEFIELVRGDLGDAAA